MAILDLSKYKPVTLTEGQNPNPSQNPNLNNQHNQPKPLKPLKLNTAIKLNLPKKETSQQTTITGNLPTAGLVPREITAYSADGSSKLISLNDQQHQACTLIAQGQSMVLLGAAGTGKTTCTQAAIAAKLQSGTVLSLTDASHKYLNAGAPGLLITAYTRRATTSIKRQMPLDIASNCITVHKALEFKPVFYEETNPETGKIYKKRVFEPARNFLNMLDSNISCVIIDEASMLSYELFEMLRSALRPDCQFVFIGDLNQLPPVFGHAILGYKILSLPVVQLTEVYRQALESPIIRLAHRILSGQPIMSMEAPKFNEPGKLQIIQYKSSMDSELALLDTIKLFYAGYDSGKYNPDEDIILCPQTVDKPSSDRRFNNTLINAYIANYIARKLNRITHEIIVGWQKKYFSIDDKIIFDKMDARIVDIRPNPNYIGIGYQEPSEHLDYFGHNQLTHSENLQNAEYDPEKILELATQGEDEGVKRQASHIITIEFLDSHNEETSRLDVSTVGELMALDLAYATTIHKSQGSEYRRVFLLLHKSHSHMLNRELLYTAVTRAKEQLIIVCEKDSLSKGILKQAIKGDTLEEKAEWFKGKIPTSEN